MRFRFRNIRDPEEPSASLRSRLIFLVVITLTPLLVFAVAMIVRIANEDRATFQRGATQRTRALLTAVDTQLHNSMTTLEALATSSALAANDLKLFHERATRVLKSQPGWVTIELALPSGKQVLDAQLPFGRPLPDAPAERTSFDRLLRTGRATVGSVLRQASDGRYAFSIRVPVQRDGALKYVLSARILPEPISALLDPQGLPRDWVGVVLDGNNRFVARTVDSALWTGRPASESLRTALAGSGEGWFRGTTLEGWDVYTPYDRSSFSGWTVALGIPADTVDATLRQSLVQVGLVGGALLLLGLFIAGLVSDRITSSIHSLTVMAREWGPGRTPGTALHLRSNIKEVEAVRQAFIAGHQLIRESSDERERAELRLRLALASANIGVYEWYPATGELHLDDRVRAHWGLSPKTPASYSALLRGVNPDDRPVLEAAFDSVRDEKNDGRYFAEFRVRGVNDGIERWIETRGQASLEGGAAVRLTGTTLDVTERKAFQKELERQVQDRTARLQETIGELEAFSYSISHDVRAPLRAMQGYSKALLEDYRSSLAPEARHYLERISRSANRLDLLVQDVLTYSKVSKGEIELKPVLLDTLIDEIVATHPDFQPPASRIVLDKPLGRVLGHEAYLTQCITNLLGNAVKFVRPGVSPEIRIYSEAFDGKVRVWFEDNGIGLDAVHHERIFQIFGQVHAENKYGGTGIGLAIVRKAVQRMNGEAGVESTGLESGSRFWLTLNGAPNAD